MYRVHGRRLRTLVFLIPTHDLVVARLGHRFGARAGLEALDDALVKLMDAILRTAP